MSIHKSSTTRFSDRVSDYTKYRPNYPAEIIERLSTVVGLNADFVIADIGSGTGLSSQRFIENGNMVYAVEPNLEMRQASQAIWKNSENFIAINGTAEDTTLRQHSIDLIFCGQAYHWFDFEKTKLEFNRILKPGRTIVLAWNERSREDSLQQEYEQLLKDYVPEYSEVTQRNIDVDSISSFLAPRVMHVIALENQQIFDLDGLKGRLMSSSYSPKQGEGNYEQIMAGVEKLFNKYQQSGTVTFRYDTLLYIGK